MVLNNNRYTKHYYIEGQRICSKLGKGFSAPPVGITQSVTPISGTYTNIAKKVLVMLHRGDRKAGFDTLNTTYPASITIVPNSTAAETDRYFYHSDHLGSSSFISNNAGTTTQHLQYLPPDSYRDGESFVEQKSTTAYLSPYRFSGKEKDEETGYSYFGARYYNPELSVWLSVDPLAEKYPSTSAYMYCLGNPVILIDPNGMETIIPPTQGEYEQFKISKQAQQRFEAILNNIESFTENKEFMNAFSQTTGLNSDEIKEYLTYGKGPKANINYGNWANATGANSFSIGADIINNLGSISSNDENSLGTQAFGVAMVLIDELSHNGDMDFNLTQTSTGESRNNQGKQNWHFSPSFHRGGDSQIFGFGVSASSASGDYTTINGNKVKSGQILLSKPQMKNLNFIPLNTPIPDFNKQKHISTGLNLLKIK